MFDQLARVDMSVYFQILLFVVLLTILMRLHWRMGAFFQILFSTIKYFVFILIVIYLFLNWASDVNPTLRSSSLLIMTLLNIYMLWNTATTAFEVPYRKALHSCVDAACTAANLDRVFLTGRRFYKIRYCWASLTSGSEPRRFLRTLAAARTRDDLHHVFAHLNPSTSVFGPQLLLQYLTTQLARENALSEADRAAAQKTIEALRRDAWCSEKTGAFLHALLDAPESLLETGLKETIKSGNTPS